MKPLTQLVRDLSKKHRERIDKSKQMAEKMIKTAEAARSATQKK